MGDNVKKSYTLAGASAAILLAFASGMGAANAADMSIPMKAAPVAAGPSSCTGLTDFFLSSCVLSYYGVTVYGTVDMGYGYQTHGAPWDPYFPTGASEYLQKMNNKAMWGWAPNGMSQSTIGIKIQEPLVAGWKFVAALDAGFDPYSLQLAGAEQALIRNAGVGTGSQSTNADSSRAGQWYNGQGFAGVSNDTWGTLTFMRQNTLTLDGVNAYDPMGGAYAFSPIGFSGTTCGAGDTENCRMTSSVKYRVNIGPVRVAAMSQLGGYSMGNSATNEYEGQIGGDIKHLGPGTLSLDVIGTYVQNSVNLGANSGGTPTSNPLTATFSNDTSVMALSKYSFGSWATTAQPIVGKMAPAPSGPSGIPLTLYAGYEWIQMGAASSVPTSFTTIGYPSVTISSSHISNLITAAGGNAKVLQVGWFGGKYGLTKDLDLIGAYYHYDQNTFNNQTGCVDPGSSKYCKGTYDAFSGAIDWRFLPKWDAYLGTMFNQSNGGLNNGYTSRNNLATTAGVRFRF